MRSTDSGGTWSNRTPPLAAPISCRGIAVDPTHSNTVIAVFGGDFGGGEVWTTTDGGDSWTNRSAGLPANPMQAVVYDGSTTACWRRSTLWARKTSGFTDRQTWERRGHRFMMARGPFWWSVASLSIQTIAQTILVATDGSGVNRTTDGGGSWEIGIGETECTSWTFVAVSAG